MEFSEKLQFIRKQHNLTQEQLAEALFVSRTAVSKWESGKGYPNIDSLKNLSALFSVSIDELLSGEEIISLAESERRAHETRMSSLIFGLSDLMSVACIFLPFYGQPDGDYIRAVSLFAYQDIGNFLWNLYFWLLLLMMFIGLAEIFILVLKMDNLLKKINIPSLIVHTFTILLFIATRQPYVAAFLFMFYVMKVVFLVRKRRLV